MREETVERLLWWLCLAVAPALLIAIELFHPANFTKSPGMFAYLCAPHGFDPRFVALDYPGPQWWFVLHLAQTPLVALVAVGLWLVAGRAGQESRAAAALAWLSRAATLVFLVYYTALDSIGGTGLGRLILNTQTLAAAGTLTPEQVEGVAKLLDATWVDPWVGGVGSFVSLTGSFAVLAAAILAAGALWAGRAAPWPPLVLLAAFGWQLETSHASPHGPIAFALLIVAAAWLRWARAGGKPVAGRE